MIEKRTVSVDWVTASYCVGLKAPLGWIAASYVLFCVLALPWHFHRVAPDGLVAGLLVAYLAVVAGEDYPRSLWQGADCGCTLSPRSFKC